jgi:hypothetical protein
VIYPDLEEEEMRSIMLSWIIGVWLSTSGVQVGIAQVQSQQRAAGALMEYLVPMRHKCMDILELQQLQVDPQQRHELSADTRWCSTSSRLHGRSWLAARILYREQQL